MLFVAVIEARGLSQAVARMRRITQQLPPCLFVPHTVKAWHAPCSSSSGGVGGLQQQCVPAIVAGEALATVGVSTLASLLQEVRRNIWGCGEVVVYTCFRVTFLFVRVAHGQGLA
jgi:hypothetical protein